MYLKPKGKGGENPSSDIQPALVGNVLSARVVYNIKLCFMTLSYILL